MMIIYQGWRFRAPEPAQRFALKALLLKAELSSVRRDVQADPAEHYQRW
jgi:hypothetical protein